MTVDVTELATYLNTSPVEPSLPGILAEAGQLVEDHLGPHGLAGCPDLVVDLAVKTLASELFARRNSPGGIAQWGPDGQPVRLARDPRVSVRALLAPYRGLGVVG